MPSRRQLLASASSVSIYRSTERLIVLPLHVRGENLSGLPSTGIAALTGCAAFDNRDHTLSGEWRQVGFDSENTNYVPEVTLPNALTETWRANVPGAPLVTPVLTENTIIIGTSDGIYARHLSDEALGWQREYHGDIVAGLAIDGETLLVPVSRGDEGNQLHALSLDGGDDRWRVPLKSRPFAPSVGEERIYIRTREACLAVAEGDVCWRTELSRLIYDEFNINDHRRYTWATAPAVISDRVVVPDHNAVVSLNPDNGSEQWRVALRGINSSPVIVDDIVLAVGADELVALEQDGSERWRIDDITGWATIAGTESAAYVLGAELTAVDLEDGEREWSTRMRTDMQRVQPAILGDTILIPSGEGKAYRRDDPGWFSERERFEIAGSQRLRGVAIGAGMVFVVDEEANDVIGFEPQIQ